MEENIYVTLGLAILVIIIFFPSIEAKGAKSNAAKSELHSRDRYSVAEGIQEELVKNTLVVCKCSKNIGLKSNFQYKYQDCDKHTLYKKHSKSSPFMNNPSA